MANIRDRNDSSRKPLRLWPGVVAVALLWLARFGLKLFIPGFEGFRLAMLSSMAGALILVLWWVFLSRAAWIERLGAVALMAGGLAGIWFTRHESMGPLWLLGYAVPVLLLAFVLWAVATRHLPDRTRRATMAGTILLACGLWALVRTDGVDGDHDADFGWRFSASAEERLLARDVDEPAADRSALAARMIGEAADPSKPAEWPGFRGPERNGTIPGVRIETDWAASPPVELWRRPVGPGWSSFAVGGGFLYTQEQLGDDEVVACYDVSTGEPVWKHRDAARFFESNAGAGPRGTPTLAGGSVYALGATGILNALDVRDGSRLWSRDVTADSEMKVPDWGFSSSPLVTGEMVIIAAAGRLVAYDVATGEPRWRGPTGASYSSPHLVTIDGVEQILLLRGDGAGSFAPADGQLLWEHAWPGFPMVQPALTADGDVLLTAGEGTGIRRVAVARDAGGWSVEERWASLGLKPYFNGFVVHEGHVYGFDNRILAAIDLEKGERQWKGGRYGSGQLVLLPDQDLLLVLSEKGELALVEAKPDGFVEVARFAAIEGKTWNHPVLVDDLLLVRNGAEMAAFRLPLMSG